MLTTFRCIDGPYDGLVLVEDISWRTYDRMRINGVDYFDAGRDGDVVLLTSNSTKNDREQREAGMASLRAR